ncbi:Type 1 fimbrial protein [Kosakonia quasisacchari]
MRLFKAFVLPVTCLCIMSSAYAGTQPAGGVIHFRGAIVEGGCETRTQNQNLLLSCLQNNKMQTQQIPVTDETRQALSPQVAQVQMRYLDAQQSRAEVTITYN